MRVPSLAIPSKTPNSKAPKSKHTILMPVQGKSMKIDLFAADINKKYMPKLSTALHKIQKAQPFGVNCPAPWNWVINKSIKGCSYIQPPHATHHRMKLLNR